MLDESILKELEEAAKPLLKVYKEKLCPLTDTIVINDVRLRVVQNIIGIPVWKELGLDYEGLFSNK